MSPVAFRHRVSRRRALAAMRFVWGVAIVLASSSAAAAADRGPIVASTGDAFVAHSAGSDTWSIGSEHLELVLGFDAARTLTLQRLFNPATGRAWEIAPSADGGFTAGSERVTLTSAGATTLVSITPQATEYGVTVTFLFEHRAQRLLIARVYACYSGSPTIETWTRITSTVGEGTAIGDLAAWQIRMKPGHVQWLGGLRGDAAGGDVEDTFVVADRDVEVEEPIDLGSAGRSSETFVPLIWVQSDGAEFYGGLMWSGAWHAGVSRAGEHLQVGFDFPGVRTMVTPARPFELPHAFFGLTTPAETDHSGALHRFIHGIRRGRPFTPLVTYNTWFIYGTSISEEAMIAELERAAALGVELFVLDAGWYVGAGEANEFDFDSGLGSWTVDTDKFPSGLASLADYAHGLGMKFGVWVEPERVALSTVEKPGLAREGWLATHDGDYGSPQTALICLAGPQARQWVFNRLTALIDEVHPDYLKWDNNFWINCNRQSHGHGAADGNLAHVQALYGLLDDLRKRYPDLLIENVSGGGTRLDFGMLAYTDVGWMDDRTAPARHVRHNLEGLTTAFPPAYLLSFLIDADGEPIAGAEDLALLARSRGAAVFGLTYRGDLLDEDTASRLTLQIAEYKGYRDVLADASASLLTLQAPWDESGWDAFQEVSGDQRTALVFAFESEIGADRVVLRVRGLIDEATYEVMSLDGGALGDARGDELMKDGIEVAHGAASRAHVLLLRARSN